MAAAVDPDRLAAALPTEHDLRQLEVLPAAGRALDPRPRAAHPPVLVPGQTLVARLREQKEQGQAAA